MSYNYDITVSYIKAKHKPDKMIFSYWYKGTYEENKLKELDLRFITFEESTIKNIKFQDCNMEGSRFIKCSFTDCTFAGCNLCGADFRGCNFEHTSFDKSELTASTFPERSVPFLSISVEQLQVIRIDREGVSAWGIFLWNRISACPVPFPIGILILQAEAMCLRFVIMKP